MRELLRLPTGQPRSWTMFASIRYLSLCVCGFVCFSSAAALAEDKKCTYWFGICMSCDAPLTCTSVKRAQSKPTPKPVRPRAVASRPLPPLPPRRTVKARPAKTRNQAAGTKAIPGVQGLSALRRASSDFSAFERYVRTKRGTDKPLNRDELMELYASFRLWLKQRGQSENSG